MAAHITPVNKKVKFKTVETTSLGSLLSWDKVKAKIAEFKPNGNNKIKKFNETKNSSKFPYSATFK